MQKKNNVIRLTEGELNQLIENAVKESLNEINWGHAAKTVGKGLAKGVAGAALMGACTAGAIKGCDNQMRYEDELNREAAAMNCDPQRDYIERHGLDPDDAASWEEAKQNVGDVDPEEYYNEMHPQTNESKKPFNTLSEQKMAQIIRENLHKFLA